MSSNYIPLAKLGNDLNLDKILKPRTGTDKSFRKHIPTKRCLQFKMLRTKSVLWITFHFIIKTKNSSVESFLSEYLSEVASF